MRTRARAVLLTLLFCLLVPVSLVAEDTAERVTTVDHYPLTIHYVERDRKVAEEVVSIAEETLPRLTEEIRLDQVAPIRVFLIADMEAFTRTQPLRLPRWGVAFALMENQVMLVDVRRATEAWDTLPRVIRHELSHLLLAQRLGGVGTPTWFVEGLAMWQAREWSPLETWRLMEAVWGRRAPDLRQIQTSLPYDEASARDAYRVAYAGFTERFDGETERLPAFLEEVARSGDFSAAFERFWRETEHDYAVRFAGILENRYHSRLLLFQSGPLLTIAAVLFVLVILRTWVRNRRKLKSLDDHDAGFAHDEWRGDSERG
jgi:hypothetical protein